MLDFATNAARSVLAQVGGVEHRIEHLTDVEDKLHEAVDALHRTSASLERHVEAVEALGDQLPALTAAVTHLCEQLTAVLELATPVEEAERGLRRLFGLGRSRGRHASLPSGGPPGRSG